MKILTRLCRFVDYDLSKTGYVNSGAYSLLITMLVASGPLLFISRPYDVREPAGLYGAWAISIIWTAFVAWRGWRIFRAVAMKADRKYDRAGKFNLPSEYHRSESATEAAQRKNR